MICRSFIYSANGSFAPSKLRLLNGMNVLRLWGSSISILLSDKLADSDD